MIVQSLRSHFRPRLSEWIMAMWAVIWGVYLILHPGIFATPATREILAGMVALVAFTHHDPAAVWGLTALLVGMLRCFALVINGAYSRSPIIRLVTSTLSAAMVFAILLGVVRSGIPNFGIVTYLALLALDFLSAYFAACDIPPAEQNRIRAREAASGSYGGRA